MPKIPFNVDAYTAKLIGRENVSKLDGAILELVKNTYDADASICFIYFEESTNSLYIGDNGLGMTEDVILKHWMTIGGSSKTNKFTTKKGRIQTGAKGIGRFALDRIADNCSMLTISENERVTWDVDWRMFEFGNKITDVTATIDTTDISFNFFMSIVENHHVKKLIKDYFNNTGTIFKLTGLRDKWDRDVIKSIRTNLKTLIPPEFREIFNIYLFEHNTSLKEAELLQEDDNFQYDYKISFNVHTNGNVKLSILRDEFDFGQKFDAVMTNAGFSEDDRAYFNKKPIELQSSFSAFMESKDTIENTIGDFKGTLYFAKLTATKNDREKYYYKDITGRIDIRDSFGGIRVYRDGFRVTPYGEPKTSMYDWLMLSSRKNQSPAAISSQTGNWRVNADQMHGSIYISRTNDKLLDQANRQGFVETKEFMLLRQFITNVIKNFERDRQNIFRTLSQYYDKLHPTSDIENELEQKLFEDNKKKLEAKKSEEHKYNPSQIDVSKVSNLLKKKDTTIQELENEIQMLRVLATIGIITNTYVHEIREITNNLNMKIIMAKEALELDNDSDEALKQINAANDYRKSFTSWFNVTIESVKRDKRRMQNTNIQVLFSKLIDAWKITLAPKNIVITLEVAHREELNFKCFPHEIESIINNLITNSTASFDRCNANDKNIHIRVKNGDNNIVIFYSDNGIGLSSVYRDNPQKILEPFESDKTTNTGEVKGTGMGMWIVNRIVRDYNGSIDLSNNKGTNGFHIQITLKNK